MKRLYLLIIIVTSFFLFGCAQQLQSTIQPGVDINKLYKFYVIHFKVEKRGLHEIISNELNSMGFTSSYGEEENIPNDVDAIVRYVDNWQWDLTNYMIKITITIRKTDESLLATATSFRTSLVRKDPPEMIRETLNEIFHHKTNSSKK